MQVVYVITDADDNQPIGAADTLEGVFYITDDYYGATIEYNNTGKRLEWKPYEHKYGGSDFVGTISYEVKSFMGLEGIPTVQKANVWEVDYKKEFPNKETL